MVTLTRRAVLGSGLAWTAGAALPRVAPAAERAFELRPGPASARFFGAEGPATAVWAYNGRVPGPELRVRQGEELRSRRSRRAASQATMSLAVT